MFRSRLQVITIRTGDIAPENHIIARGWSNGFCGVVAPPTIIEFWDEPTNPYLGRGRVTCEACIAEFYSGRRDGHRNMETTTPDMATVAQQESATGNQ